MDTPPVPKPRCGIMPQNDPLKKPVPLPRTKVPICPDRASAAHILRSIGSVSKQITGDVAQKMSSSAKSANEKLERSIIDGSKFARGTLEKTLTTSKAMRDSVAKSVIEGTKNASLMLRKQKKVDNSNDEPQRCVSMPVVDVGFFDNIQFHSPMLEQKKYNSETSTELSSHLNTSYLDNLSLFSINSDSNTDTVSNFSFDDVKEVDHHNSLSITENEQFTYDTPIVSRSSSVIRTQSTPEVPERQKKKESGQETMRQNSLLQNLTLPQPSMSSEIVVTNNLKPSASRPSQSAIYEFDPLITSDAPQKYGGVSNELLLLESFLIGDTYGSIISTDNSDDVYEIKDSEYFNPPTPPERSDSLFLTDTHENTSNNVKYNNSNWYVDTEGGVKVVEDVKFTNTVMQRFSSLKHKLDTKLNKPVKQTLQKIDIVDRPPINKLPVTYFYGILTRIVPAMGEDLFKNSQSRYCVLSDQKLICYSDPENTVLKETYSLESVYSVQIVLPLSSSTASNSYCFELMVSSGTKNSLRKVQFSSASASERRNWAQKIVEHLTSGFPTKYTAEFTRCGWCYLKEGVSGQWQGAWVMLIRRVLVYCMGRDQHICTVDLRKTRCVVSQEADADTKQVCLSDCSFNLVLDCPHATLYLRFPHERELKGWRYMIKLAAHNNGAQIHHQQLTKDDVPTIVDKCISFIYAHGSLSEGIYRRAGSSTALSDLLAQFRRDAWLVQLSPGQHSEHDVAGVLKRFFRDLPESLIPQDKRQSLLAALEIEIEANRHAEYRRIMCSLPLVHRNTARKLFAHLYFLTTMAHANKMNSENLASVWAPTIMPAAMTSDILQTAWSCKEVFVVKDLIANFEKIWEPTEAERSREAAVRRVLMAVLGNTAPAPRKAAGDLKVWIYVNDRNCCHQITLTPNKTSADICIELCEKAKVESHLLMLEEVVCGDSMRRIVHIDEIVLDVVLTWGYWDEEDRKDNYLVVTENKILNEMEIMKHAHTMVCGELKLATESMKTFKPHMFELHNGVLCYFKDKQGSHKIEEWKIKDLLWYVGHESKRNPQSRWAITFIPRNNKSKRSKDRPWFGTTIAGSVTEDQLKWMTAMMFGQHANVLPVPRLVIT
ncbi:hypothetical protein ACJJTC_000665 [Scirpophaga incertulas]